MSKKRNRPAPDAAVPIVEVKTVIVSERLVPASAAGECGMCKALRAAANRANYTEIYCTRGPVRYCRCKVCGFTWKVIADAASDYGKSAGPG